MYKNEKLSKQEEEITAKFKIIEDLKAQIVKIDVKKTKLEDDINEIINKMWEEYELTPNTVGEYKKPENVALTQKKVNNLRKEKEQLVQQRKSISELINRCSTQIYNAEKSYITTQKELEAIKYGKPVKQTVSKTKRSKSINTQENLYNKITELKNEFRNTTNQMEKVRLSKRIWYYNSKLKEIQKSNLQNK